MWEDTLDSLLFIYCHKPHTLPILSSRVDTPPDLLQLHALFLLLQSAWSTPIPGWKEGPFHDAGFLFAKSLCLTNCKISKKNWIALMSEFKIMQIEHQPLSITELLTYLINAILTVVLKLWHTGTNVVRDEVAIVILQVNKNRTYSKWKKVSCQEDLPKI